MAVKGKEVIDFSLSLKFSREGLRGNHIWWLTIRRVASRWDLVTHWKIKRMIKPGILFGGLIGKKDIITNSRNRRGILYKYHRISLNDLL